MVEVALDHDTGRFFAKGSGGQIVELPLDPMGGTAQGAVEELVTLGRELSGLTFDPSDGRFFAVDARSRELVKVAPATGEATFVAQIPKHPPRLFFRDIRTLAFDPLRNEIFCLDRLDGEFLSMDPATAECTRLGQTLGVDDPGVRSEAPGRSTVSIKRSTS